MTDFGEEKLVDCLVDGWQRFGLGCLKSDFQVAFTAAGSSKVVKLRSLVVCKEFGRASSGMIHHVAVALIAAGVLS
jgi:hypothetical protein